MSDMIFIITKETSHITYGSVSFFYFCQKCSQPYFYGSRICSLIQAEHRIEFSFFFQFLFHFICCLSIQAAADGTQRYEFQTVFPDHSFAGFLQQVRG